MNHPAFARLAARVLTSIVAALFVPISSSAQTTGEWTTLWMPPTNNTADFPQAISSAGKGHYVMAARSTLHRTTDGGRSWTIVAAVGGDYVTSYAAVAHPAPDRIVALVDSVSWDGTKEVQHRWILASTDAGATWRRNDRDTSGRLVGVAMFDREHGIVGVAAVAGDSVLRTTDGGITWTAIAMPTGAAFPYEVYALGATAWRVRAHDGTTNTSYLFATSDAGATWSRNEVPGGHYALAFMSDQQIWSAGTIPLPQGSAAPYHDVIRHSTDGGATWTVVLDTIVKWSRGLQTIAFADAMNGMATGPQGHVFHTTDGGVTWELQWIPTDRITEYGWIRDLAFPAPDEAIGVNASSGVVGFRGRRTLVWPVITAPASSNTPRPLDLTVTWTRVDGATAYDLQIADTIYDFDMVNHRYFDEPYFEREGLTDTSVSLTLRERRRFVIRVRARNAQMVGDWSMRVYVRTIGEAVVVATPSIVAPPNQAVNQPLELDLTWTEVPGAVGYEYRIAYEPTYIFTHVDVENHIGTTARVTALQPNTEYFVRVRARDADGELSGWARSVFHTGATSSVDGEAHIEFAASLQPNVTSDRAHLRLSLARSGTARIRIVDATGADAIAPIERDLGAGTHMLPIDVSALASGRYFARIAAGAHEVGLDLVVVR